MSRMAEKLLRRLEFTVLRRLDGLLHGDYRTLFRGYGLDLADLREYQFHDDVRHIDWNVTARMDTPYVRDFHEDREMSAWFLLDLSASVDFGSGEVTKRTLSVDFVTVMARLLTGHGNRVGGIFYSDRIDRVLPARGGRRHVLGMVDAMLAPRLVRGSTTTRLEDLLAQAARIIPRRSVVFVVSDFLSEPGWAAAMQRLTHRHEVVGVRLYDPLELALPDLGMVVMQDAETGEQLFVDTHDKGFRRRFEVQALARESALQDAFAEAGIDAFELATDEPMADAVIRFSELRKMRGRLGAGGVRGGRGPATSLATAPAAGG
ncbi:MAG: DUF58 domain-containing protein [Lautropia sp.]